MTIRYGSVCSGIEAATRAFHALGWSPAFFAEIEKFPSAVLAHWYGSNMPGEPLATNGVPNYGDFTQIGADAGPVDLLVGGTPCQSFSVAGKRLGLDDPRGNLALEYLALARRLGARWILWENVPGVLSSSSSDEATEEGEEAEGLESADFATFLSFVQECGYGFAYRVLDAQYIRVDEYARAVPQRRRRVFVVGYLGDWRRAAAVLLEPEGMRWDSAPRREAGKSAAGNPAYGISPDCLDRDGEGAGGTAAERSGLGLDPDVAYALRAKRAGGVAHAFGGGNTSGSIDVSTALTALTAHGQRQDFEVETFVAHSLRGEGFDASEDGTGRGTPIVPVCIHSDAIARTGDAKTPSLDAAGALRVRDPGIGIVEDGSSYNLMANGRPHAIAFDTTQITSAANYSAPQPGDPCHPLAAGAHAPAIAIREVAQALTSNYGEQPDNSDTAQGPNLVASEWAVRRLTPRECERLQGFPDDFTSVPFNGKPAADGPRYKALGNSMAVNVMRWLGQRIDIMEKLIQSGALDAAASTANGGAYE